MLNLQSGETHNEVTLNNGVSSKYTDIFSRFDQFDFAPYKVEGRQGVALHSLYDTRATDPNGPAAAIVRYDAGARTPRHVHPGYELVLVLSGELQDDRGTHGPGALEIYPPGSNHELTSATGCTFLVVWERPVTLHSVAEAA